MESFELCALLLVATALTLHLVTVMIGVFRTGSARSAPTPLTVTNGAVTILRPVCGIDEYEALTLRSTFELDSLNYEIIFCCAREQDPVVPLVRSLIAEHPHINARLLIGDDRSTANPKLNNLIKGWHATRTDWVIMADSNVLMPPNYIDEMFAPFGPATGLVCSPPVGSVPRGFWAELECAFLNTYQARWQLSADAVGFGFAQGKSMLWRKRDLDRAGGIEALALEIAEDAAATKIVRSQGLKVRLVDRPFPQPLGTKTFAQVWQRQVRWARLRRSTFTFYYLLELLAGFIVPAAAAAISAASFGMEPLLAAATVILIWLAAEALLAVSAGWHVTIWSPLAWLVRDLALPVLWVQGLLGNSFNWRGNEMTVANATSR